MGENETGTTAIAVRNGSRGLQPASLDELFRLADMLAASGMVPKNYDNRPGAIVAAVQMGAEVGLSPMASLQNIAVINGRPSLWGDGMLAVARAHPDCESIVEVTGRGDDGVGYAECRAKRRGQAEHVVRFSVDDAKRAGLWGKPGPWQQYPKRMLQMRARAWALRDTFADALRGLHCAEEVRDCQIREDYISTPAPKVDVTAPAQPTTARVVERVRARAAAPAPVVDVTDWSEVGPPALSDDDLAQQAAALGDAPRAREPGEDG